MPTKLALLSLLVVALTACGGTDARPPAQALRHATPVAAKTQWVGTHGIEVAVPASWPLNNGQCGTPQSNTVMWNEGAVLACLVSQPPGLSVVEFGGPILRREGRRTTIGGLAVRELSVRAAGMSHEVQITVLRRGITVTVLSPEPTLLHQIVASLHAVRVDANGCAARTPLDGYRRGSKPAAGTPFVPAGAVRVVACSYGGLWIDRSSRLGRTGAARLARGLNAAPFGFSRPPAADYLQSICPSTWRGSRIVARFEYAHRPPVVVTAHIDGCSRLGASNGRWAVRMRGSWVYPLVTDSRYGGSFPDLRSVS